MHFSIKRHPWCLHPWRLQLCDFGWAERRRARPGARWRFPGPTVGVERLEERVVLSATDLVFSVAGDGVLIPDVGRVDGADLVRHDGERFSLHFDGSDVGLDDADIDAFAQLDDGRLLLSFASATQVDGLGSVAAADVLLFTPECLGEDTAGSFARLLVGADFGLTWPTGNIDALDVLADGSLVISTPGNVTLPLGPDGARVTVQDEDLLRLAPAPGSDPLTDGFAGATWELFFDGTAEQLTFDSEDIDGVAVEPDGRLHLSTWGSYSLERQNLGGGSEDVFTFQPGGDGTAGSYLWPPLFDGNEAVGSRYWNLDAFDLTLPLVTNNPPTAGTLDATLPEDGSITLRLPGDDGEPDSDQPLAFVIVDGPAHGRLELLDPSTGEVAYVPDADYHGEDSFRYLVREIDPDTGEVIESEPGLVRLVVESINDAPALDAATTELSTGANRPVVLTGLNVSDVEAGSEGLDVEVTLRSANGVLTPIGSMTGVGVRGAGSGEVVFRGSVAAINALLAAGVEYRGRAGFAGEDSVRVLAHDLGNSGAGGPLNAERGIRVQVLSTSQQVARIRQQIEDLADAGEISRSTSRQLLNQLKQNGRPTAVSIRNFIRDVEKLERRRRLDAATADALRDAAESLLDSLTTETPRQTNPQLRALERLFERLGIDLGGLLDRLRRR